ncbi:MAG TPA: hypothetical protein VKU41_19075, partial [Polyangiaceae bacterium]|nr:hypothetical protein [Polyangiaceae bacterium]
MPAAAKGVAGRPPIIEDILRMQATELPFSAGPEWTGTDRYTVIRKVGEGGMGVVYEAHDRDMRR